MYTGFLVIKSVTYNNKGIYECQVNSDPYRTFKFHFSVVDEYFSILPMFFSFTYIQTTNFRLLQLVNVVKINFYIACNWIAGTQIEEVNDVKLIQNLRLNSAKID